MCLMALRLPQTFLVLRLPDTNTIDDSRQLISTKSKHAVSWEDMTSSEVDTKHTHLFYNDPTMYDRLAHRHTDTQRHLWNVKHVPAVGISVKFLTNPCVCVGCVYCLPCYELM